MRQATSTPGPRTGDAVTADGRALTQVRSAVLRFVSSRGGDGYVDGEDVVQEAMTRLLENRSRLEPGAWEAYAIVSARNLMRDRDRAGDVRRRLVHRLHAPDLADSAEEQLLTAEEHTAVRRALTTLDQPDAVLLSAHYTMDEPSQRSLAPAAAARLARARAKLRVAYLLEHTGLQLPTVRCRPVLEAVSSGDRRRQDRLGAARHLSSCRVCATYAPVLTGRQRALAALHPLAWVTVVAGSAWGALRRHPARTGTASAGLAVAVAAAVVLPGGTPGGTPTAPPPSAPPPAAAGAPSTGGSLTVDGQTWLLRDGAGLPAGAVRARKVVVHDVPADEGFWIGNGPDERVWVQLVGQDESRAALRPGDVVSFTGQAVLADADYVDGAGLTAAEGREELRRSGMYVVVPLGDLVVTRR